jgi:hypothetical protein
MINVNHVDVKCGVKMKDNLKENIICSAIWYKDLEVKKELPIETFLPKNCDRGVVFCGFRHGQCLYSMVSIYGLRQFEAGEEIQGFLTNKNRFVDRVEGAIIFIENGGKLRYSTNWLYSEDLY